VRTRAPASASALTRLLASARDPRSWLLNQHIETVHAGFLESVGLSADEFQACLVKFGNGKHLVERIIASEQRLNETRQKILGGH